ncbi:MAG: transketolase [Candidatus Magasanikbacteria bacterium RIFCSPHIGHO2_02_FULL_51_14]|uniref:Transketolase n=1 Tax=Candidatus Magasanikbacteria bacterium RIFCSPHIGHO2_02_FULL_51_14 TaxID=1798683 RepID=A0A1F6MQI4_9BACT|nr:MAG: transketolase [Candidatus Magasanikbacteria bacterium RIFCSPHIGHO2_02_FULL_51_14]
MNSERLAELAALIRYYIIVSTTEAGSGHPTSSLSATDLMTVLLFGGFFRTDLDNPKYVNNDRLIFSKGHASPLFYALYAAAGKVTEEELLSLRKFDSPLEGHPTMRFPYTEAATGSLGQGLSVGVGMALNAKYLDKLSYRTFVLLGDSEMAEGSVWEAMALAAHYKLDNLVAILDVNRLGQRGETMYGHHLDVYEERAQAFGWRALVIDGHDLEEIVRAYEQALGASHEKPVMIIAQTVKGKGVSLLADHENWHGKPLSPDDAKKAIAELGLIDKTLRGKVAQPDAKKPAAYKPKLVAIERRPNDMPVATRRVYGEALAKIHRQFPDIVALDAEVKNSTYSETFEEFYPDRFFEMFIAEQNMVGTAVGLSARGKLPFCSTFAAFLTRAFDQIRMAQYSDANITFVGSHAGVSIGEDGPSQMGLEDIAMFRTMRGSVVLYPSDAVSMEKLVEQCAAHHGIKYIRTTRGATSILYSDKDDFPIGGSKVVKSSKNDAATIVGAGVTLHEALKAYDILKKEGIAARVIDLYSVKPVDEKTLRKAAVETKHIITVEDHYPEGGLGEAVRSALPNVQVHSLAVTKMPRSGKTAELLGWEEIDAVAIVKTVKGLVSVQ